MTVSAQSPTHVPGPSAAFWRRDCDRTDPHGPHRQEHRDHKVDGSTCRGDHRVWCYGVVDPDSLRGELEALRPGQRIRVVFEGIVDDPRIYGSDVEWPALSIRQTGDPLDDLVVLRFTGGHPGSTDEGYKIRGPIHNALVSVEVIGDADTD